MTGTRTLCNGYGEKVEHKFIYAPSFPSSTHSYPGHHKYSSPLPRPTVFLSSFPLLPHTTILFSLPYLLFPQISSPFSQGTSHYFTVPLLDTTCFFLTHPPLIITPPTLTNPPLFFTPRVSLLHRLF